MGFKAFREFSEVSRGFQKVSSEFEERITRITGRFFLIEFKDFIVVPESFRKFQKVQNVFAGSQRGVLLRGLKTFHGVSRDFSGFQRI